MAMKHFSVLYISSPIPIPLSPPRPASTPLVGIIYGWKFFIVSLTRMADFLFPFASPELVRSHVTIPEMCPKSLSEVWIWKKELHLLGYSIKHHKNVMTFDAIKNYVSPLEASGRKVRLGCSTLHLGAELVSQCSSVNLFLGRTSKWRRKQNVNVSLSHSLSVGFALLIHLKCSWIFNFKLTDYEDEGWVSSSPWNKSAMGIQISNIFSFVLPE